MAERATPINVGDPSNKITINSDGTYSPSSVTINNGGILNFDVSQYPTGTNQCNVTIGSITFSYVPKTTGGGGGTVKIGS